MFTAYQLGFGSGGGRAFVSLTDNSVDASDLTAYTFSSQSLGAAAVDRRIIVGVTALGISSGATVSTLTVAGVSATSAVVLTAGDTQAEIWIANVPTGTTGDIVVTHSAGKGRCGIGVYRAVGSRSTARATATDSASDPLSASLFIPSNGIAVGVAMDDNTSTYVWTNLTERYDEAVEGSMSHTGASLDNAAAQTPTITANPSGGSGSTGMALASWDPN